MPELPELPELTELTEVGVERGELIAGRYELLKRLGRGGMGEVWAARDRMLHRDVAVKLLDLDGVVHPELPQRFEREAVAAAQINHPTVVALYDRGIHEDMLFLVMEKVEGATLTELIHGDSPISLPRALEIAGEICTALVAAHRAQVIHYDIKPHNVMLTPDGQVKVVDFGIAGFVQTTFTVARSSQLTPAGTPEYGAPEQFLTERGDERSDLYALGGVFFAMLTRRPPFTGHSGLAVMRRKLDEEAPRLDSLRPDLPPAVTELVAELLQRDPDHRPQTARQVHERLRQLQTDLCPTREGPSGLQTTVVRTPPTLDDPPKPLSPEGPFIISWTGKEPLSAYANAGPMRARIVWYSIVMAASLVGCFICVAKAVELGAPDGKGWRITAMLCGAIAFVTVIPLLGNSMKGHGWSLKVGPPGIRITSGPQKREYPWSHIEVFAVEEVIGSRDSHRATAGLHIKFIKSAKPRTHPNPPGWPYGHYSDTVRARVRDGMVPICVLGPMTDQQQAALREALTRYGQGKSYADPWGE
ncbi:serine/threonine-protein kinase [Streptomyces naphthomycinicus]|uniref:serine/threonine-protein kinase n=1 Tax=Streptomyces naphthomycinicus TaxID=2872625 RepID=UPI001CECF0D2|nr:serine/threonine-protein kinase [Streptomyces sp. TML10]